MAEGILSAVVAVVLAFLPILVEWVKGKMERQQPSPGEVLAAGQARATATLAKGLGSGDVDSIAEAFEYNEKLTDVSHRMLSLPPQAGAGPGPLFSGDNDDQ